MIRVAAWGAVLTLAAPAPAPVSPSESDLWGMEKYPPAASDVEFSLDALTSSDSPAEAGLATPGSVPIGEAFNAKFDIRNASDEELTDVQVTARRGSQVSDVAQARQVLAQSDFPYWANTASVDSLGPGDSTTVNVDVETDPDASQTLGIHTPGTYPVLFTLTGTRQGEPVRLSSQRLLLTVADPDADPTAAPAEGENTTDADEEGTAGRPFDLSLIVPVSTTLDPVPGATGDDPLILRSEKLAGELEQGGRLYDIVDSYRSHEESGANCLAVDPALIHTVDQMTQGYFINDRRPDIDNQPTRLRDSWGEDDKPDMGDPGRGAEIADEWLEMLAEVDCLLALPWANTNLNAVVATGDDWLLFEAVERGSQTIERVLNRKPEPLTIPSSGYISGETASALAQRGNPATVMLADNAAGALTQDPAAGTNVPEITTYNASLAATLAATGDQPATVGYSDPNLRFDERADSTSARTVTAAAALRLASRSDDTIALAPSLVEADVAEALLTTTDQLVSSKAATARPLNAGVSSEATDGSGTEEINNAPSTPLGGSPYPDPTAFTDSEVAQAGQQARYTNELMSIMTNDPAISMTRYSYTLPLRRDLLLALSNNRRNTLAGYDTAVEETAQRIQANGHVLTELRESVSVIPPGNVYTRVSEFSPLLIVARNQLPLPVNTRLNYEAPADSRLNTPNEVIIPARGSITVNMTADILADRGRTDISLWLATEHGSIISAPVDITVQTRSDTIILYGIAAATAVVVAAAVVLRVRHRSTRSIDRE